VFCCCLKQVCNIPYHSAVVHTMFVIALLSAAAAVTQVRCTLCFPT
jgi:hypothetical protein